MSEEMICYFCGKPITKVSGFDVDSLQRHHESYDPEIIVPSHMECHLKHHGKSIGSDTSKVKLISLEEKHFEWIEKKCLNFSKWIRMKIDEEINEDKKDE